MRKVIVFVSICFVAMALGAYLYVNYKPHKKIENQTAIAISATDIAKSYATDETKANVIYLSKAVLVNGIVSETDKNQDGGITVVLDGSDPSNSVQCAMRDKKINIIKGQKVTIKGMCSGSGIMGVTLTGCIIE